MMDALRYVVQATKDLDFFGTTPGHDAHAAGPSGAYRQDGYNWN